MARRESPVHRHEAFGQPTMDSGGVHAQDLCGLADRNDFSRGRPRRWLEARDAAITPQTADLIGGEAFPGRCLASLTIQDAGDDLVGIEGCQTG